MKRRRLGDAITGGGYYSPRQYHHLMATPPEIPVVQDKSEVVVVIVDAFLDFVEKHLAPDTYRSNHDRLEAFCRSIPSTLTVKELKRVRGYAASMVTLILAGGLEPSAHFWIYRVLSTGGLPLSPNSSS
jgi:hypothetical protein